jgi:hypothetical protein
LVQAFKLRLLPQQFEAAVLVVLMGLKKYAIDMASDGMIYIRRFMTIGSGIEVILRLFITLTILEAAELVVLIGGSVGCMKDAFGLALGGMIYI